MCIDGTFFTQICAGYTIHFRLICFKLPHWIDRKIKLILLISGNNLLKKRAQYSIEYRAFATS